MAEEHDACYKTEKRSYIRAFDFQEQAHAETANSDGFFSLLQKMQIKLENLEKQVQTHTAFNREPFQSNYHREQRSNSVKCFYCYEEGHIRKNCWKC